MKNFCFFSGIIVIIFVIVAIVTSVVNDRIVKKDLVDEYYVNCNGLSDYNKINADNLKKFGGWFEVLDMNYECIYPEEKNTKYSLSDMVDIMNGKYMIDEIAYRGIVENFKDSEGKQRVQITFFESKGMNVTTSLNLPTDMSSVKYLLGYIIGLAIFIILYCITVFCVSKRIQDGMMKSINQLHLAMSELGNGNYKKRVNILSGYEFAEMGESFNLMAVAMENAVKIQKEEAFLRQQLISDIGHDIRTPLTVIQGYLIATLNKTKITDLSAKRYLENCYQSSVEMEDLLQQLIEYNKMLKVDYHLELSKANLSEFIREVVASKYEYIIQAGKSIKVEISDVERIVKIDLGEMKRVIVNLLNNAVYHNLGKTKIYTEIRDGSKWFYLIIADDGTKIDENMVCHIYEPFFRGEESRRDNQHSGLGLSIVKKIIDKHGFYIELKQPYRKWTKAFVIRIEKYKASDDKKGKKM